MTTTTRRAVACECGHQGYLVLRENDQPFSGLWEEYSLDGFDGCDVTITGIDQMQANVLSQMNPKCPECGKAGKVKYA